VPRLFVPWLANSTHSVHSRTPKPAGTADTLLQLRHLNHIRRVDALQHELGNPIALLNSEIGVGVVEQQHLDGAAVIGVDDPRARVDEVLGGETGARCDTAICMSQAVVNSGKQEERERETYKSQPARPC